MPTFQVLFSDRTPDVLTLDGVLHDEDGAAGRPVSIVGARPTGSMLDLVIPATLDAWAERLEVVTVRDVGDALELAAGDTRVRLHPAGSRA